MTALILDLDGVLITTPSWRSDAMHMDGYSDFDPDCVKCLNELTEGGDFEIWISSDRRRKKSLDEFKEIFLSRGVKGKVVGYIQVGENRKEEIEGFIGLGFEDFIIIDDDKRLNDMDQKDRLILTDPLKGFNRDKLEEAKKIIRNKK